MDGVEGGMTHYLTIPEAAQARKQHPKTLRDAIARGELQGVQMGKRWFVTREAMDAYPVRGKGRPRKAK